MTHSPRILAIAFALLFSLLLRPTSAQQTSEIGIGTWNIEFLGAAPHLRRDTPPRSSDDILAIGAKLRELRVAVLGVQEICGEKPMQRVCKAAGPTWSYVLGTSGSWSDGKTQQGVGFFYDRAVVELLHAEELLNLPSEHEGLTVFHRKPVTACFRHRESGSDFRVVVVHLKAGRKDRDLAKRRTEATLLTEWLRKLQRTENEDQDIIVLGDFNSPYGADPERIFEEGGNLQYLDQQSPARTIMHFDAAIDQIVVTRACTELVRNSRVVHDVTGEQQLLAWRRTYSDHFPVTARMRFQTDDDAADFTRGPSSQVLPVSKRLPVTPKGVTFAVGSVVTAHLQDGVQFTGELVNKIPQGPGGWVVLRTGTGNRAIPLHQIRWLAQ